jgi:PPIC-type peptidyl-prolyl cis-trans isomerase-like protein
MIATAPLVGLALGFLLPPGQETASRPAREVFFERSRTPLAADTYCEIDGFPIKRVDYGLWLQKHRGDQYVQQYVTGWLVRKAAEAAGAAVTPAEVDRALERKVEERTIAAYRGNRERFIEMELNQFGKTMEQFREEQLWDIETDLLIARILKKRRLTTDADVEKEFRRLYGASGRELHLRAILLELDVPTLTTHKPVQEVQAQTAKAIEDGRRKGVQIVKRIQSGEIDFASAALAYSDDASSKGKGGDVGRYVQTPPEFGDEFDAALQRAKPGQVIGPIRIQAGYIVAEIGKEALHDLAAERDKIRAQLAEREPTLEEVQVFLRDLIQSSRRVR